MGREGGDVREGRGRGKGKGGRGKGKGEGDVYTVQGGLAPLPSGTTAADAVCTSAFRFAIRIDSPIHFKQIDSNGFILFKKIGISIHSCPAVFLAVFALNAVIIQRN